MSISPEVSTREPGSATGGAPARANHFILKRGTDMRVVGMVKQGSQKLKDRIEEPESSESTRRTSVFASLLTLCVGGTHCRRTGRAGNMRAAGDSLLHSWICSEQRDDGLGSMVPGLKKLQKPDGRKRTSCSSLGGEAASEMKLLSVSHRQEPGPARQTTKSRY